MTNPSREGLKEEIERVRGVLTKRYMISGTVTPRVLALSQYLDSLLVAHQREVLDMGSDRLPA